MLTGHSRCLFWGVLPLINHFRLTSWPQRQRWIEVLSRPIATKPKSNWWPVVANVRRTDASTKE